MNEFKLVIELIRDVVNQNEKSDFPDSFDDDKLISLIKSQEIITMVWPVVEKQESEKWKNFTKHLEKHYNKAIYKALMQQMDIQELLYTLEEKEQECLPLKGWIMRNYYPAAEMRSMTDFDVLIKDFKYEKLKTIMEGLGYEADRVNDEHHDIYIKKPYTLVELHKRLSDYELEEEVPVIDEWLDDIWTKCKLQDGSKSIYELKEEDFYIYHLIHMYRHFTSSGCGIRPLIDIYVFMQKFYDTLDWDYLTKNLCDMQLDKFENVMRILGEKCFAQEREALSAEDKKLLGYMVSGSLFGTEHANDTNRMLRSSKESFVTKRAGVILHVVFPTMDTMNKKYQVLKRCPILLPVFWIVRIVDLAFTGHGRMKSFAKGSSKEEYNKMKEIFEIAGIK